VRCLRPLAVDAIVVYDGRIVLVRRRNEPFKDMLALPGGFVEKDETVEEAVLRETKEETGLDAAILKLVGVYSDPRRDPRGPVVSICFLLNATSGRAQASSDASRIELLPPETVSGLAFDHDAMLRDAMADVHRLNRKWMAEPAREPPGTR
jgi:8-oxo-dGTP diphosphatase